MHITVLISSTEWSNFIALRDHEAAEPHIRILAQEIRREIERTDNIQDLEPGDWHLPFEKSEEGTAGFWVDHAPDGGPWDHRIKLSVARCASTSYKTVEGFDMDMDTAYRIHDKLLKSHPLHASPAEHVCQADEDLNNRTSGYDKPVWKHSHQHGNFVGFRQYRKMLPNECL
jgi:hypothetical protein